jgi:HSP20 family molecular chaperone IbpA
MDRVNAILNTLEAKNRMRPKPPPPSLKTMIIPHYDFIEHVDVYKLVGEYPGVSIGDIDIEFEKENTITVSCIFERKYETGDRRYHIPNEDDYIQPGNGGENGEGNDADGSKTSDAGEREKKKQTPEEVAAQTAREIAVGGKYWLSERRMGYCSRSFHLSINVYKDEVDAEMHNGLLTIVVPKVKKPPAKKIPIRRRERSVSQERDRDDDCGEGKERTRERSRERVDESRGSERMGTRERSYDWMDDSRAGSSEEKRVSFSDTIDLRKGDSGVAMGRGYSSSNLSGYGSPREFEEKRVPSVLKVGGKGLERRAKVGGGRVNERNEPRSEKKDWKPMF